MNRPWFNVCGPQPISRSLTATNRLLLFSLGLSVGFRPQLWTRAPNDVLYRFADFTLDSATLELTRSGERLKLQPQPAKILLFLLERAGQMVAREDLRGLITSTRDFADLDQAVNFAIRKIRVALEDENEAPCLLETLPRLGYRFLAAVTIVEPESLEVDPVRPGTSEAVPIAGWRWSFGIVAATVVVIAAALATLLFLGSGPDADANQKIAAKLAVLPLEVLGSDQDLEAWARAWSEALIVRLTRDHGGRLAVLSPASTLRADTPTDIPSLARTLGQPLLLLGSVQPQGDKVFLYLRLWRPIDQKNLWAASFEVSQTDNSDVVLDRVLAELAQALELPVPSAPLPSGLWSEQALRASFLIRQDQKPAIAQGLGLLEALARTTPSARLHENIGYGYLRLSGYRLDDFFPQVEEAGQSALALDPMSAQGDYLVGSANFYLRLDFAKARRSLESALRKNPCFPEALQTYGLLLAAHGRARDGVVYLRQAVELDPRTLYTRSDLALALKLANDLPGARNHLESLIEMEPGNSDLKIPLAFVARQMGDDEMARIQLNEVLEMSGLPAQPTFEAAVASHLRQLDHLGTQGFQVHAARAHWLALMGAEDAALAALELSCADPEWLTAFIASTPEFAPWRHSPRFRALGKCLADPDLMAAADLPRICPLGLH